MINKRCYLLISFIQVLVLQPAFCQDYIYTGYVQDSTSGEYLISANLYDTLDEIGTSTNQSGFFSFQSGAPQVTVQVTYVGYHPRTVQMMHGDTSSHNIRLSPIVDLNTIEVVARKQNNYQNRMGTNIISTKQLQVTPAVLGERDVLKTLQFLPGVQGGEEGQSGLLVRGGGPDQNLVLLDGVPLYNTSHLFGFFSSINTDAIKHLVVMKGGFPARYAGRLSSVVDITTKDGNDQKWTGDLRVGMIASTVNLEGPIKKGRTTMALSARRTLVDFFGKSFLDKAIHQNGNQSYFFHDFNLKFNHKVSDRDRFSVSIYQGQDAYERKEEFFSERNSKLENGLGWSNLVTQLKWNHKISDRLFSTTSIATTSYKYTRDNSAEQDFAPDLVQSVVLNYDAGISDIKLQSDIDFSFNNKHLIRSGIILSHHRHNPGSFIHRISGFNDRNEDFEYSTINALEGGLYVEDEWKPNQKLVVHGGVHLSYYLAEKKHYAAIQPRIISKYLLSEHLALSGSYSRMVQYPHLLTSDGVGLPNDLWFPSTKEVKPEDGWQTALGLNYSRGSLTIATEGYYRKMSNVLAFRPGTGIASRDRWQDKVLQGEGNAYGGELLVEKRLGNVTGIVSYTLSWSNRQFDAINEGREYAYTYDRRHQFSISGAWRFHKRLQLSANWIFYTGKPFTIYERGVNNRLIVFSEKEFSDREFDGIDYGFALISDWNGYRLGIYHRLDVEIKYEIGKLRKTGLSLGAYNVYNRRNPNYILQSSDRVETPDGSKVISVLRQVSIFPFLPTISISQKF